MIKMTVFKDNTALILIDIQNDFCPGGALEVEEGNEIVEVANKLQEKFRVKIATQDWHPPNHTSFASNHLDKLPFSTTEMFYGTQVLWPDHCIQGKKGAEFHPKLITKSTDLIIRKGFRTEIDSYSAFFENDRITPTGLEGYLIKREIKEIYLCGLAFDYCVFYSALDGIRLGFDVFIFQDLTKAIDLNNSYEIAKKTMIEKGIKLINFIKN